MTFDRPAEDPRQRLGRLGERWAARHLRRNGFKILYRNFRAPQGGEVDLVCRDKVAGELVFVEVKTRRSAAFGRPAEAVTADKQRLIAKGALAWLRLLDRPEVVYRFDVVEVLFDGRNRRINLIRAAFTLPERFR